MSDFGEIAAQNRIVADAVILNGSNLMNSHQSV